MSRSLLPVLAPLREAAAVTKCHRCGCFQDAVQALRDSELGDEVPGDLKAFTATFEDRRYDCLGCEVCWPSDALNAAAEIVELPPGAGCATEDVARREGWPPLPGEFHVLDGTGPVAACTLHSRPLVDELANHRPEGLAIVGSMQTENLGIERLIENVISNPALRVLVVCGEDTAGRVGHFPGQTLLSLFDEGVDDDLRVKGAKGKRPILKNLKRAEVDQFLAQVTPVDLRGETNAATIAGRIQELALGAAPPYDGPSAVTDVLPIVPASLPANVRLDPAGFIVIHIDRRRGFLRAERFSNQGVLLGVVEGDRDDAVAFTLVERGWVTRLDHAAYVGRELSRAQAALRSGSEFVQDGAPQAQAAASCCESPNGECSQ